MKILGIDPGTRRIGYGLISKQNNNFFVLKYGCFQIKKKREEEILKEIFQKTKNLFKKTKPHILAIEKIFFFKNQKTAFAISQARGVIILAATQLKIPICQPTPLEIKTCLTGYGRADKKEVARMLQKLLQLNKIPQPDDTTDALACALTAFYLIKKLN